MVAARATALLDEWSGLLLGAAPTMSLGEDNSWRSLATAAAVACVWAFFCVVGALSALAAALNTFGSSARRSGWNARLAGVLLASTARLAAAGPANASVAPFSDDISRTRRKLTGYVFAEHVPTEFENDMHYLQDAAGEDVEPLVEDGGDHAGHDHGRRRLDDNSGHDHGASSYAMDDVLIRRRSSVRLTTARRLVEAAALTAWSTTWDTSAGDGHVELILRRRGRNGLQRSSGVLQRGHWRVGLDQDRRHGPRADVRGSLVIQPGYR